MNRNLWLLAVCQGLFLTNNVTFIAINGLVGLALAPLGWMATLPVMGYVVGGALSTGIVARTQKRFGRKASFQFGLGVAVLSALLCCYAAYSRNFWLLVTATVVAGYYNANAQLYRFAAAELALPAFREKAVSLVMAGGLIGAIAGPNLAAGTRSLTEVPFAGAYLALAGVALLAMALLAFIHFPPTPPQQAASGGRPLGEIMRQPVFIVAAAAGALGFGVMNLLMAATPIAMQVCGLPFSDAALVLEWHVIGMFAPGFFTGHLIKRFGTLPIMAVGLALNVACVLVALSGVDLHQFLIALFLLGVGWNFLFTGSTTLALTAYRPEEKDKAQGALNFCVFAVLALSSLASGVLVTTQGWTLLNLGSLLPLGLTGFALAWLALRNRALRSA
ncbi:MULTISPECIES: MFS transporter [unclassified Polaromonas]|jgi:MFS family permease|uniref:MFS transporter n=1 Tax=unclassified Polaromonas TaxID=2638319 RepID=UPI000BCF8D75|nr:MULTISPECIES: MFS transporter [unclassified Polaromonas]OYY32940.1 MAG: MFS transporter [Polaromonas sp. 35-63-35]OYZ16333.1 MAG: MFS transporter [Polaromonas sp. 16-63-31]OYZ76376.1 MAG: MFS transporter [Polaromonas sp. 24-63-21]OZA48965.1 MAG: MFS transporter [Polaromonas sp. 17-63-33]OZA85594.1 MAG: MFS transporter [Polaromonas sp. 39-63-25]